jgi:hypothetical protein
MDTRSALSRHQRTLLEQIRATGLCTDESLSAHLSAVGEPTDRTTLVRYRAGERAAPLGLLPILLGHVDDPGAVLDLLARPCGLRVVADTDIETDQRGLSDRALELAERSGVVVATVRAALSDGIVTADERQAIGDTAAALRRAAAELEALARRGAA